jgi:hypothetical protein
MEDDEINLLPPAAPAAEQSAPAEADESDDEEGKSLLSSTKYKTWAKRSAEENCDFWLIPFRPAEAALLLEQRQNFTFGPTATVGPCSPLVPLVFANSFLHLFLDKFFLFAAEQACGGVPLADERSRPRPRGMAPPQLQPCS